MSLTLRLAVLGDAAAIGTLHVRSWQVAYRGIIPDARLNELNIAERIDLWHRILAGDITVDGVPPPMNVVVERDGAVIGFANIGAVRDKPEEPNAGELWAMYVDPDAWGAGAGFALMNATFDELDAQGYDPSYLWVLTENHRARRFYERQGWMATTEVNEFEMEGTAVSETRYRRA